MHCHVESIKSPYMPILRTYLFALCLIIIANNGFAAEVLSVLVEAEPKIIRLKYDLAGKKKERSAKIAVSIELSGTTFFSEQLSMSGDFGSDVSIGSGRIIEWKYLEDFPEGLKGTVKFNVNVANDKKQPVKRKNSEKDHNLLSFRQNVLDEASGLRWTRNAKMANPMKFNEAQSFVSGLNKMRFAGYNDWRLPEKRELEGLFLNGKKAGWGDRFNHYLSDYLNSKGFEDVQGNYYWSSTLSADGNENIAVVNTWNGVVRELAQNNYYSVLPVRSDR